jgi:hypothetical protein
MPKYQLKIKHYNSCLNVSTQIINKLGCIQIAFLVFKLLMFSELVNLEYFIIKFLFLQVRSVFCFGAVIINSS